MERAEKAEAEAARLREIADALTKASLRRGMDDAAAGRVQRRDDFLDEAAAAEWLYEHRNDPDLEGEEEEVTVTKPLKKGPFRIDDCVPEGYAIHELLHICSCTRTFRDRDGDSWTGNDRDGYRCTTDNAMVERENLDELRKDWGPLTEVTE